MSFTNMGLVEHVKKAKNEHWGYVRGTFGQVLTEVILNQKLQQCGNDVGRYLDFIKATWMGKRTADCVNLIKSYLWWDNSKDNPVYNSKYDVNADDMFYLATEKGTINTIPEIDGICVWHKGHIGIYIGNGKVIEAQGTKAGVVQTPLFGVGANTWTHWLKCSFIEYIEDTTPLESALEYLTTQKIIDSPDYWLSQISNIKSVPYLEDFILKIVNAIKDKKEMTLEDSIKILADKEIINSPDYWVTQIQNIKNIKYLDQLIIKLVKGVI